MRFLINCSNLRQGGGIQVADSICASLNEYKDHHFGVVLPSMMGKTYDTISGYDNVSVYYYELNKALASTLFLRDDFLDRFVKENSYDAVLTIFGPSRWRPRAPHLCGFARAHILPMDTPYFSNLSYKEKIVNRLVRIAFDRCSDYYWTENPAISELLQRVFPDKHIYTISNTYNQVFDNPNKWNTHELPPFEGITMLTVTNAYPHKNLGIALKIAEYLDAKYDGFNYRFVFTIKESEYPQIPKELRKHFCFIGSVDISECPSLYKQSDIVFQPTLLECFTATYAEAMRMGKPIITTDLDFAKGLCGDAAIYYSPLDAQAAAEAIYKVASDNELYAHLIANGEKQLSGFDDYRHRSDKLIKILETIANK